MLRLWQLSSRGTKLGSQRRQWDSLLLLLLLLLPNSFDINQTLSARPSVRPSAAGVVADAAALSLP